jgi:hypothetical protein
MCDRQFACRGQGHESAPALTLGEFFATSPPFERPIVETVLDHVARLGAPLVDQVGSTCSCRGRHPPADAVRDWIDEAWLTAAVP